MHPIETRLHSYLPGPLLWGLLILLGLSLYLHFLVFHILAELFTIVVSGTIFLLIWNSRRFLNNGFFLTIGAGYLAIAILDLAHTLTYKGMGIMPQIVMLSHLEEAAVATELWIAARLLEAFTLLTAMLFGQRLKNLPLHAIFLAIAAAILWSIFVAGIFPASFIPGQGLTPFKVGAEYFIIVVCLLSAWLFYRRPPGISPHARRWMILSLVATAATEWIFTLYSDVQGLVNATGHFTKVISYYFLYRAVIESLLRLPQELLFRDLKSGIEELQTTIDALPLPLLSGSSEEQLSGSQVLRQTRSVVMVTDTDALIRYVNPRFTEATGYTSEEVIGRNPSLLQSGQTSRSVYESLWKSLHAGQVWRGHFHNRRKNGEEYIEEASIIPIYDQEGKIVRYVAIKESLDEKQRAEKAELELQLREQEVRRLREEMKRLERFSGKRSSEATSEVYGIKPLRESTPDRYAVLRERYSELFECYIEAHTFRVDYDLQSLLDSYIKEIGELRLTPRDLIELHAETLSEKIYHSREERSVIYRNEGRLFILEIMGLLSSYYRAHCR